jgi:hypothetical protein
MHMASAPAPSEADRAIGSATALPDGCSLHLSPQSSVPEPPLPQAVHEMSLPLIFMAALLLLATEQLFLPLTGPPRAYVPVPLRPPIPFAA